MTPNPHHPADHLIDRALHTLRDAQPRAGADALNRRILANLESHAAAGLIATNQRRWRFADFALPTAAAILLTIALIHISTQSHNIHHTTNTTSTPTNLSSRPKAPHLAAAAERPASGTISIPGAPFTRREERVNGNATASSHNINFTPSEQALLDDLHAPGQPAPPLPLTRDERMLVRAARRSNEVQLAQLESLPRPATHSHRDEDIAEYVHHMLAPLVAAESIDPTPATDPDTEPPPSLP
jgi:hypothetical protein